MPSELAKTIHKMISRYPYRNLVFKGGGVRGIAYIGALEVLEEKGILPYIEHVAGTSAGAIAALLVSLPLRVDEILDLFATLDFRKIPQSSTKKRRIPSWLMNQNEKFRRFVLSYGIYSSEYFYNWLHEVIAKYCDGNENATFADFQARGYRDLHIMVSNLSQKRDEVFSYNNTPNVPVADAVRMSMSIPMYFEALQFNGKTFGKGDFYVDGGLFNNYPIKIFDEEPYFKSKEIASKKVNPATLGFFLQPDDKRIVEPAQPRNLLEYMMLITITFYKVYEIYPLEISAIDQRRSVAISDCGISSIDFKIVKGDERYNLLRESGRRATEKFLKEG